MEERYETLLTIYEIVKADPSPHTYLCTPHEIILRQPGDWPIVQKHLEALAEEKFILTRQLDKLAISITPDGIMKAKTLKNNFINSTFTFRYETKESSTSKVIKNL